MECWNNSVHCRDKSRLSRLPCRGLVPTERINVEILYCRLANVGHKLWLLLFGSFTFISCSNLSSERPKTNQPEGQAIYYSKCGGCHRIYDREKFTPAHWETELVDMKKRAKLTEEQAKKVLLYLTEKSIDTVKNN